MHGKAESHQQSACHTKDFGSLAIRRDRGGEADGGQHVLYGFDRREASDPHAGIGQQSRSVRVAGWPIGQERTVVAEVAGGCYSVGHLRFILPVGCYEQVNMEGLVVVWRPPSPRHGRETFQEVQLQVQTRGGHTVHEIAISRDLKMSAGIPVRL